MFQKTFQFGSIFRDITQCSWKSTDISYERIASRTLYLQYSIFVLDLSFDPEDWRNVFLRNIFWVQSIIWRRILKDSLRKEVKLLFCLTNLTLLQKDVDI
jgi:hypothetical protein